MCDDCTLIKDLATAKLDHAKLGIVAEKSFEIPAEAIGHTLDC